jgi:HD-GYP domain-containing protein (c-di-GMP phosphodiesterase class II)
MSKKEIEEVTIAGLLHDIGKIKLDKNILHKPGNLSKKEFDHIKKHSQFGYDIIKSQNISTDIKMGVLLHHEKIDGSGYPLGLKGADIHKYAKIIAIADIYDAMTSDRPHRKKFSPFTAIQMFEQKSYGLLDTKFLFVFLENIAHNYLGTDVLLSTGKEAKIVFIHNTSPSRPIVQVDNSMIDLMVEPNIMINEII